MTSGFSIRLPADLRLIPKEEVPSPFNRPEHSTLAILDLARLWREDREDALRLADESAAAHWQGLRK